MSIEMQQSRLIIAAALSLAGISSVFAASSVDLVVKGTITPSACTPTVSSNGLVDHGKISVKDLSISTQLPDATLQLAVVCDAATLLAVKGTDNRPGTAWFNGYETISLFGLGLSADNQKLGAYRLVMENTTVDGAAVSLIESVDGETWFPAADVWQPRWMRAVSGPQGADHLPVAIQNLATDVVISTFVRKPKMTTEEIPLDGSATLDIVYL
ncbi:DUF1120 domain-containing protein [Pseudomonas orientalis]|uniref:DUF1120 domain-containing protein n=2 Tax=Pseudomonas orientalis TaxID=76758 RepID=UPI001F14CE43|nr:DUF1120 domain-containing protein [Pseudomonas orientalis]